MKLFGREYTRSELLDAVGDPEQLGGASPGTLTEGAANGMRIITVRSPGGLSFVCLPDRGLDLGWADYQGMPLAWRSPVGDVGAAYAEHTDQGWLRTFGGGLVTTCGLATVGQPGVDQGEMLGLHGRCSSTPAREVRWSTDWSGNERIVTISGRIREGTAVGPVLEMHRTITASLGQGLLRIDDVVTNLSIAPAPHMFRYHVNFGFPLIDHESRLKYTAATVDSRDPLPPDIIEGWNQISPPSAPRAEQVFVAVGERSAEAAVEVVNPVPRPSLRLHWSGDTLPLLLVWKQPTRRTYVTALEPSNCRDEGRAAARAADTLVELQEGEERRYWLELSLKTPAARGETTKQRP